MSLYDTKRIERIKTLLECNPDLFWVLFSRESLEKSQMRTDGETIAKSLGVYSSGEQVLLKLCLDIWFYPCKGYVAAADLWRLDDDNIERVIHAYLGARK